MPSPEYMEDVIARLKSALLEAELNFTAIHDDPAHATTLARNGAIRVLGHHRGIGAGFRTALTPETSRYDA